MPKSRISPGESLFQIVVQTFPNNRNGHSFTYVPPSQNKDATDRKSLPSSSHQKIDVRAVSLRTLFRWAKDGRRAQRKVAKRFGSVISCQKVDSHTRRLEMIEHLNLEEKPIYVDVRAEEFTLNRNLEVSKARVEVEGIKVDIDAIDK